MSEDLKKKLSPLAWQVTQEKATERPFTGEYDKFDEPGKYYCVCCDSHLFNAEHKFDSGCGWPAFHKAKENSTEEVMDYSHGMTRVEILCGKCNAHLGHKFADGPYGTRYCINSVSMNFKPEKKQEN
jgi:methionine-R-sulfoxide reductase